MNNINAKLLLNIAQFIEDLGEFNAPPYTIEGFFGSAYVTLEYSDGEKKYSFIQKADGSIIRNELKDF